MTTVQRVFHDWLVLFAMVNCVGNLPVFADLTSAMDAAHRHRAFRIAVMTAGSIVLVFAFLGNWMLRGFFQVDTGAFKIAGGILVFGVAARGMITGARPTVPSVENGTNDVAVFPMGFPFLAGPGTIVTTILLMQSEGPWLTAIAGLFVYATILPILYLASHIHRATGKVGTMVIARILYIFICAKAVTFILDGFEMCFPIRG